MTDKAANMTEFQWFWWFFFKHVYVLLQLKIYPTFVTPVKCPLSPAPVKRPLPVNCPIG